MGSPTAVSVPFASQCGVSIQDRPVPTVGFEKSRFLEVDPGRLISVDDELFLCLFTRLCDTSCGMAVLIRPSRAN
jgi:hypothetical protein